MIIYMRNISAFYFFIICLVVFSSCKEDAFVYTKNEVKGKAVLRNTLLETKDTSIAKTVIYLSRDQDSDPYLYKIETNAAGEYTLPYLPELKKDEKIYIVGEYTGADKIKYTGYLEQSQVAEKLILEPQYPRGKLKVTFLQPQATDVLQGDPDSRVNGAEVYLFTNKEQAQSLLLTSTPKGQLAKKNTNERGIALFYDLLIDTYYLVGKTTDAKGKSVYSEIKEVSITDESDASVVKEEKIIAKINKTLTVTVKNGSTVLPGAEVYLFKDNSQTSSLSNRNGPFGVEKSAITQANGEVKFEDLTESSYYVGVRFKRSDGELFPAPVTQITLTKVETKLDIPSLTFANTPFKVKVTTGTTSPEPVYNTAVYVFTNKAQLDAFVNSTTQPTGFFRTANTDASGEATFTDIFSGLYYIGAIVPTANGQMLRKLKTDPANAPTLAEINY